MTENNVITKEQSEKVDIETLPDNNIEIPQEIAEKITPPDLTQDSEKTTGNSGKKKIHPNSLANLKGLRGRKGIYSHVNREIRDILSRKKDSLIKKAIELAEQGNVAVLCKLLDKVAPTLNVNENRNFNIEYRDEIEQLKKKAVELGIN